MLSRTSQKNIEIRLRNSQKRLSLSFQSCPQRNTLGWLKLVVQRLALVLHLLLQVLETLSCCHSLDNK
uniref:Uncharacterized protein n=1 Tax=uncultured marine virus TaxID=186617 RepID=A0A0F7L7J3_9VIRU|nr:hypothetical protein [uncultured marine virus]